jgi:single-strand DNA-binding protein
MERTRFFTRKIKTACKGASPPNDQSHQNTIMASLNKIILIGNLTRDPEVRYTPKGAAVCDVSIAVNRKWKDEAGKINEEVTYVEIVIWGKTAEHVGQYLKKGSSACFEGRLQQESWEDKTTGQKRSKLRVVAETVQFLGSPNREGGQQAQQAPRQQAPARRTAADSYDDAEQQQAGPDGDDVPF